MTLDKVFTGWVDVLARAVPDGPLATAPVWLDGFRVHWASGCAATGKMQPTTLGECTATRRLAPWYNPCPDCHGPARSLLESVAGTPADLAPRIDSLLAVLHDPATPTQPEPLDFYIERVTILRARLTEHEFVTLDGVADPVAQAFHHLTDRVRSELALAAGTVTNVLAEYS